jgi:phosphohistidine phosphatase
MTRRHLHLLRHAKSNWDQPLADHDRPLNGRGRRSADALARHLPAAGITPRLILCSSAARTRETLERIRSGLPDDVQVLVERDLYGASAGALLARVRELPDRATSAMVIAHNPGIGDLAAALAGAGDPDMLDRVWHDNYPTGALASLVFDGGWSSLAEGTAELEAYVVPRALGVA